jgi:hypothetical protein
VRAVGGKKGASVIAQLIGNLFDVAAIDVHRVQFGIAAAHGSKHNFITLGTHGGFSIVTRRIGERSENVALQVGDKMSNVE